MPIEIEKKYRLTAKQRAAVRQRLDEIGVPSRPEEFEENTLYQGGILDVRACVLRLRRVAGRSSLTYKERFPTTSLIKHQREEETEVADPEALAAILKALGYEPRLVYEKRRTTWQVGKAEVVIDQLPFGWFMEIEAGEKEILRVEKLLAIKDLAAEGETYPRMALKHGKKRGSIIEARFSGSKKPTQK
jgi:predicted adenylyl cyclase CyaB